MGRPIKQIDKGNQCLSECKVTKPELFRKSQIVIPYFLYCSLLLIPEVPGRLNGKLEFHQIVKDNDCSISVQFFMKRKAKPHFSNIPNFTLEYPN